MRKMIESSSNAPHRKIRMSALSGCLIMGSTPLRRWPTEALRFRAADGHELGRSCGKATRTPRNSRPLIRGLRAILAGEAIRCVLCEGEEVGACAEKQCGRVLDPVGARLPPVPPAFRKPFVHEHRLEVAHRNCWFTIDLFGIGFVGKKSE